MHFWQRIYDARLLMHRKIRNPASDFSLLLRVVHWLVNGTAKVNHLGLNGTITSLGSFPSRS